MSTSQVCELPLSEGVHAYKKGWAKVHAAPVSYTHLQFGEEIAIMATLPSQNVYSKMRDLRWSPKEKAIARRAFDRALHRELSLIHI